MKLPSAAAFVLGLLWMAVPAGLDSCGIAPPSAVFATRQGPADLRGQFLHGRIGVLQRTYQQRYLIGAFRILSGLPLTAEESESLYAPPAPGEPYGISRPPGESWLSARGQISSLPPVPALEIHKSVNLPGLLYSYPNCLEDAFRSASHTLTQLIDAWGADDPRTLDWASAQDQVFANCSGADATIPPPVPAGADRLLAAHRRYQIAAALFYSGDLSKSAQAFREIASDKDSPWHDIALYLTARALLRAGLLNGDLAAFRQGKQQIQAILDDSQSPFHEDSLALLHLWQLRAEPRQRLAELSRSLLQPSSEDIAQTATDFLFAIKHHPEFAEAADAPELPAWLAAMSNQPPSGSAGRAAEAWRNTHNPAWLIAALANGGADRQDELTRSAAAIAPTEPAYESVAYYAIGLERRTGHLEEARRWADRALGHDLLRSTRNWILAERLDLARNWSEFLRYSLRRPEPDVVEFEQTEARRPTTLPRADAPIFDSDVLHRFDSHIPLALWLDAAGSKSLPSDLQLRIAQTGWLRAVLIGRPEQARALMQRIVELQPGSAEVANQFLAARTPEEARFAAIYVSLWAPGLCPYLPVQGDATVDLSRPHALLANEFGYRVSCWPGHEGLPVSAPHGDDANFLTAQQRSTGAAEARQVEAAERWLASFLLKETLLWSRAHPDDARVPRALHLAVTASRYRDTDAQTGTYSKQAFDLLHRRYPKSQWTALTPYWYK